MATVKFLDLGKEKQNAVRERGTWGLRPGDTDEYSNGNLIVFSPENWGDEYLTPDGLPEGDMPHHDVQFVPLHDLEVCDIYGNPVVDATEAMDWSPDEFWEGFFSGDEDEIVEAQPEEPVYVTGYEDYEVDTQTSSMKLTQKESDDQIFSEYDDEYAFPRILSSSPSMACNSGRPNNEGYEPKAYFRWDHPRECRYKDRRKGGGRLSRRKSRSLADLFCGCTVQIFVPPRVAVVNGTPEDFPLTRRHLVKKIKADKTA